MKKHLMTLWKGFRRLIFGVGTASLLVLAVKGFCMIPMETGYLAVWYFVLNSVVLAMGLYGTYLMGGSCKQKMNHGGKNNE